MKPSPNDVLRNLQIRGWKKYSPEVRTWIMMANFFFAILPGIIFLIRNVFIEDEIAMTQADVHSNGYWTFLLIFGIGVLQSIFQMTSYNRFMSLRLVRTFFVGQCISLVLILLSASKDIIKYLRVVVKPHKTDPLYMNLLKKAGAFALLTVFCYTFFFLYRFSGYSDV